jgi:hypothetical protein
VQRALLLLRCMLCVMVHNAVDVCVQASIACYEPKKPPTVLPTYQPAELRAKSGRHEPPAPAQSETEAYIRGGLFSSANPATAEDAAAGKGRQTYPLFAQDAKSAREAANDLYCTKKQVSSGPLSDGLLVRSDHGAWIFIADSCLPACC